jgi:hypothetical protein
VRQAAVAAVALLGQVVRERVFGRLELFEALLLEARQGLLLLGQPLVRLAEPPVDKGVRLAQVLVLDQEGLLAPFDRSGPGLRRDIGGRWGGAEGGGWGE